MRHLDEKERAAGFEALEARGPVMKRGDAGSALPNLTEDERA
jgi:hypothetical protein